MATSKPQRSPAEIEDIILRKIFHVTLNEPTDDSDPRIVFLEMANAEILGQGKELLLSGDLMERLLIDRLNGNFSAAEQRFPYLIGCYRRAHDESKKIQSMKDKNLRSEMEILTKEAKQLVISHCWILLANPDVFGNSDETNGGLDTRLKKRNTSPLLPFIFAEVQSLDMFGGSGSGLQAPPGFLDEFFKDSRL